MGNTNEIIERLENLANHAVHRAGEPPFVMSLDDGIALHEAIDILKTREPRLITLEEADKAPYVWLESKEGGLGVRRIRIVPIDSTAVSIQTFGRPDTIGNIYEFEKRFRCWNAKPTDEQRQNEPWKE